MLSAVRSKEVSGSSARRQYTENCARSPTGKETGRDKFDHVVANSQTDVFFSYREGVSGPNVLVHGITSSIASYTTT